MMKAYDSKVFLWILGGLALLGVALALFYPEGLTRPGPHQSFGGATMGTTYHVQIAGVALDDTQVQTLKAEVDAELLAVNQAMSTYMPESEISMFNRGGGSETFEVSPRFREVLARSFEINQLTDGRFDPTLGPLIDLWGFGAKKGSDEPISQAEIDGVMDRVGMAFLTLTDAGLQKHKPGMEINLSAIAKGYAVDRVAALLMAKGFENVYVEIGGELVCAGVNAQGIPWRIGIQVPAMDAEEHAMKVISLADHGLATSGDYRNYVEDKNGLRHHILDPRTGRPARHTLASVSVLASDCMSADAVSTALFVMGTEEGMAWVEKQQGIDALFIDREGEGYRITATPGFEAVLIALP